jgi:hypothetical protein
MTALAISTHDRDCSAARSDPRMTLGSSCRPNQSQPLPQGFLGRISSGSASGRMMRMASVEMRQVGTELVTASGQSLDLASQLGALANECSSRDIGHAAMVGGRASAGQAP